VPLAEADRAELGYWLRADETGRGYVTEAVGVVLELARPIHAARN
jgi:RimJ/RimL family protein N-acetyltransferase